MTTAQKHQHHHASDETKDLAWQKAWAHPFFADPAAWIAAADQEQIAKAFGRKSGMLMCIDEGIEPPEGMDAVHMAGSGILYKHDEIPDEKERLKCLAQELKGKNITAVCSHVDCGACALYCSKSGIDPSEGIAQDWAKHLAEELGVPYHDHIHPTRRPEFHNAICAYYDGSGHLSDPVRAGLPQGFIVSRGLVTDEIYEEFELGLAIKIAFGAHGFGEARFTPEHPFHIVVIVHPDHAELTEERLLAEVALVTEGRNNLKVHVLRAGIVA
jgi:hypothetical protein